MKEFIEVSVTRRKLKLICGVGINDAPYKVRNNGLICPYYTVWATMIQRCYKPWKGWEECVVCKEWHYFMAFRKWMKSQDWKNKYLDKDILVLGNKEYGPNNCIFVSQYINALFQHTNNRNLPKGIHWYKPTKKYMVNCHVKSGVNKFLGYYSSLEEANEVYVKVKTQILDEVVKDMTDVRVIDGLYRRLEQLKKENLRKVETTEANKI